MRAIISVFIILPLLAVSAHSQMSPRDRYLSPDYVQGADSSSLNE